MGKYEPLRSYLSKQTAKRVTLHMREIEKIMGACLPASAYKYVAWWSNSTTAAHPYSRAWTNCGYYTVCVKDTIRSQTITFEKR